MKDKLSRRALVRKGPETSAERAAILARSHRDLDRDESPTHVGRLVFGCNCGGTKGFVPLIIPTPAR